MSITHLIVCALIICWSTTAQANSFHSDDATPASDQIVGIYDCETGALLKKTPRFQAEITQDELLLAAAGNCIMKKDEFDALYCESGTCTGSCRLANFPLKCRCE